jgi:hypothetical protein
MNRLGLLFALCMVLTLAPRAEAGPVPTDGTWQQFAFVGLGDVSLVGGCGDLFGFCLPGTDDAGTPPWTFTVGTGGALFNLVGTGSGDEFGVVNFANDPLGELLGGTPTPGLPDFVSSCDDPVLCLGDPDNFSRLSIPLGAGDYEIGIIATASAFGAGFGFFQVAANQVPIASTLLLVIGALGALGAVRRRPSSTMAAAPFAG